MVRIKVCKNCRKDRRRKGTTERFVLPSPPIVGRKIVRRRVPDLL